MRWRRAPVETREAPYTEAIVRMLEAQASGTSVGDPSAIAALEAAAGLYARCFAAAEVSPPGLVGPAVRALIGRNLIRSGESVHLIEVVRGSIRLVPVGSWLVAGPWSEDRWVYRLDTFGPSGSQVHYSSGDQVVHVRYAVDPSRPWEGISPLGWAATTGTLAAHLEQRLGEEAGGAVAHVLPVPQDGGDGEGADPLGKLKEDIRSARGRTFLAETTSAGWGEGRGAAPAADWQPRRIGANPPAVLQGLRSDVFGAVLSACGVPVSLFTDADGTSQRESFRRFLTTGLEPLGQLVAAELSAKLDTPGIRFDFTGTYAHDLAGRAAAFQKLVAGGMALAEAVSLAGLVVPE